MNKLLLTLLLATTSFLYANSPKSPEMIFLNELRELSLTYGSATITLKTGHYKPLSSEERKSISFRYVLNLPKLWLSMQTMAYHFLNLDGSFKYKSAMQTYLENQSRISPLKLYRFFKPLITSKKFNIQTGDIIMTLPHRNNSFIRAYMMDSAYSHADMVFIDSNNNTPYVFNITPDGVIKISLARYLCGYFNYINSFAFYRYNQALDKELLNKLMQKIDNNLHNLFFDEPFVRDTKIENIASFMEKPTFYYCTELVYAIYSFVLKNENIITSKYVSIEQMIRHRKIKTTPVHDYLIKYATTMEKDKKQWIIDPKNFYQSPYFSPTAAYGNTKSIRDKFQ